MRHAAVLALAALATAGAAPADRIEGRLVYTKGVGLETIWIADADGRHPRRLVRGSAGFVSPSGESVAFQRGRHVYVIRSDGSGERRLAVWTSALGWLPDSRVLALRGRTLITIDAQDGRRRTLVRGIERGALYGWSVAPSGRFLAYALAPRATRNAICGDRMDLYVMSLAGGSPRRLTRDGRSAFPVWGRRFIAFSRIPRDQCFAPGIWRMRPDGSDVQPLIARARRPFCCFGGYYGYRPYAWLADGRLVVGIRSEWGDEAALVRGRSLRRLGPYVEDVSRDGRFFVGTLGGANGPYEIGIGHIGSRNARVVARGNVCCPDWNR